MHHKKEIYFRSLGDLSYRAFIHYLTLPQIINKNSKLEQLITNLQ